MYFRIWRWVKAGRRDLILLCFAWKHPQTPRYIKVMLAAVMGYLISPVDFIPDYLPLLGIIDDLAIVPAALFYITGLLPPEVRRASEERMRRMASRLPYIVAGVGLLMAVWVAFLFWGVYMLFRTLFS